MGYRSVAPATPARHEIKRFRLARGLTQAQLAAAAHLSRTTLNQLENGLVKDLGIRKVQAVLEQLGLVLATQSLPKPRIERCDSILRENFAESATLEYMRSFDECVKIVRDALGRAWRLTRARLWG